MHVWARWGEAIGRLHGGRGLRAGVAVAGAMTACYLLGKPMGWAALGGFETILGDNGGADRGRVGAVGTAALGGFETILVDNGGPYRSRLRTMATVLLGGAVGCVVASMVAGTFWLAVV